jgi:periplasmic divalent cation tolerance protein
MLLRVRDGSAADEANSMTEQVIVAFSTCPDEATAQRLAHALVSERLATCVNRIAGVTSTYFWDGRLQDDAEILLIIKTTAARQAELAARLKALHPYELPELVVLPVAGGNEPYLQWVRSGVE